MSEERPYFVFDDTGLLALGEGNSRAAWIVTSQESERVLAPVLTVHAAGQTRSELVPYVGTLPMSFPPLDYAELVSCYGRAMPPGAAHAAVCAAGITAGPVFLATTDPDRYKNTTLTVVDLTP